MSIRSGLSTLWRTVCAATSVSVLMSLSGCALAVDKPLSMPSGADANRIMALDRGGDKGKLTPLYVELRGANSSREDERKPFRCANGSVESGTFRDLYDRFESLVGQTRRFTVYRNVRAISDPDITVRVEGAITSCGYKPVRLATLKQVETYIEMSVVLYDYSSGRLLSDPFPMRTVWGRGADGSEPLPASVDLGDPSPEIRLKLSAELDHTIDLMLGDLLDLIERRLPPLGKVALVDHGEIVVWGGQMAGFRPGDQVIVFSAQILDDGGEKLARTRPLARARCETVSRESAQCALFGGTALPENAKLYIILDPSGSRQESVRPQ